MRSFFALTALALMMSCNSEPGPDNPPVNTPPEPSNISYTVVNVYPHDTSAFTQGLQWYNGYLYEGTGLEGQSRLMKMKPEDGKPLQLVKIDDNLFGEGITILNNKIFQLTWQNHRVLVYDLATLKKIKEFNWDYEGWGITNNGKDLIISTGSNNLYFVDPETFRLLNTVGVNSNYGPLGSINELEYIKGKVYANVWGSDYIAVINPQSGAVEGRLDFTGLLEKSGKGSQGNENVLNGIAYDSVQNRLFITGKKWPAIFEVKLN
ncbi:MAG TPA: glutaminyl-peptide cyclotransferase [Chitinophagaceae bacterium]